MPSSPAFDATPVRRPTVADYNGCAIVDDPASPPSPDMPSAASINNPGIDATRIAVMLPLASVYGSWGGSSYSSSATSPSENVDASTFTLMHNATGDTTITWPAGTFEPANRMPRVAWHALTDVAGGVTTVSHGVRIKSFVAGVAADVPFTVDIFGDY